MYALSVVVLILTIQDGIVMWYEALILVLTYLIYIAGKYCSKLLKQILNFFFDFANRIPLLYLIQ